MTNWWWLGLFSHVEPLHLKVRQLGSHHAESKEKENNCRSPLELWSAKLTITLVLWSITSIRVRVESVSQYDLRLKVVELSLETNEILRSASSVISRCASLPCSHCIRSWWRSVTSQKALIQSKSVHHLTSSCIVIVSHDTPRVKELRHGEQRAVKKTCGFLSRRELGGNDLSDGTLRGDWPDAVLDIPVDYKITYRLSGPLMKLHIAIKNWKFKIKKAWIKNKLNSWI